MQPVAGIDAQPLADQAAHGQADKVRVFDIQGIEQRQHVLAQLFDAVRASGDQRGAMAAGVVAQYAKVLAPGRDLRIPHAQVGAQELDSTSTGASAGPSSW